MNRPKTLLLIDDEEEILEILKEKFEPLGIRCVTTSETRLALRLIDTEKPDAILSDVNMPGMNGLQLLEFLRAKGDVTPLLFLTGFADKENVTQALRLGATDFHEKPVDYELLKKSVLAALELGKQLRTLDYEIEQFLGTSEWTPVQRVKIVQIHKALLIKSTRKRATEKKAA